MFYDYVCLDQSVPTESLRKVNVLYANSPCLCLTNERYLRSSWCLFELCVSSLNRGNPQKLGLEDHPIFTWLYLARLVQEMGYAHTLQNSVIVLDLPTDKLQYIQSHKYEHFSCPNPRPLRIAVTAQSCSICWTSFCRKPSNTINSICIPEKSYQVCTFH